MRFNFPNDPIADELYPYELENVILIHYLRTNLFNRHRIFADLIDFRQFIRAPLIGSNKIFQSYVLHLTDGTYPFP